MDVRTRFAPSPTGFMHLGGLRTALYNYLYARKTGGKFILRIEDTDQARYVEGATQVIYDTLKDAGILWDEGPDVGGPMGPYIQSERKEIYQSLAQELIRRGGAYYCFCTKEELDERRQAAEANGQVFKYDKKCLHLSQGEIQKKLDAGVPYVIRMNAPSTGVSTYNDIVFGEMSFRNEDIMDDMVLIKQDGMPTYNFANVVDDHSMGITHIMRGMEYLSSTPRYNYLYQSFGWDIPEYVHLPIVMRDATHKLSKRDGDAYYSDFVDKGYLPEALSNYLALVGWNPGTDREFFTLDELVEAFDLKRLNKSPGIFDIDKLTYFNFHYIREMNPEAYLEKAAPWYDQALAGKGIDYRRLAELTQSRTEVFNRLPDMVRFLGELPPYETEMFVNKKQKSDLESSRKALALVRPVLENLPEWTETALHDSLMETIAAAGMKNGTVLWPLRIAIAGQLNTPGGAIEIAWLLGREETLRRLADGIARLG